MKAILRIFTDTLQSNEKWSAKRITAFSAFTFACVLAYQALNHNALTETVAFIVGEFLSVAVLCLGISSWQKTQIRHINQETQESQDSITIASEENNNPVCNCGGNCSNKL